MIKLISIGKLRDNNLKENYNKYEKRLRKYTDFETIEVKKESQAFKQAQGKIIVLDEKGKDMNSKEFAQILKNRNISFIIGPAEGFKENHKSDLKISLSNMTFPHQMIKLFLIEQIYRGFTIINKEKYHK